MTQFDDLSAEQQKDEIIDYLLNEFEGMTFSDWSVANGAVCSKFLMEYLFGSWDNLVREAGWRAPAQEHISPEARALISASYEAWLASHGETRESLKAMGMTKPEWAAWVIERLA